MDRDTAAKFDAVFSAHKVKQDELRKAREKKVEVEKSFAQTFNEFRDKQIRPILEEIRHYLSTKGVTAEIETSDETPSTRSERATSSEITLSLRVGDERPHYRWREHPHLSMRADPAKQVVIFFESTIGPGRSGHSGSVGEYKLELVNRQLIEQKTLALVKEVFS
jgi:hypothetical protein